MSRTARPYGKYGYVCACSSYAFPHRPASGRCECDASQPELCEGCGQPSEVKDMDFGIGSYEFWGCPGVDTNVQTVTVCCEVGTVPNRWSEHLKHNWEIIK